MMKAKTILKDKFWIVESDGERVGTLSLTEDKYLFSSGASTQYFDSERALKNTFGKDYNFPTSCSPYNSLYDVKNKLPLFTKSNKSKSLYCAGYYIIHFDKGWVKSFCPKLITIERYNFKGPFKTDIEMRQALSIENAK
jgi:hypothetical protein